MNGNPLTPVWILTVAAILFALAVYFGLRFRKKSFQSALQIRAREIWVLGQSSRWNFTDLLYGILQDFSAINAGLIVRDSKDEEVGRIYFHSGVRQGWITFNIGDENFQADSLPTLQQTVSLRRSGEGSSALCTFRRLRKRIIQVEVSGVGVIESKAPLGVRISPTYEFAIGGSPVGSSRHIGGWQNRGTWLVLPASIPLPVRMFILAMQSLRA